MSEPDVSNLLSVQRAIEIIDAAAVATRRIKIPLNEAAGLRLAQDVAADRDYPPFDKSLMDGFALRSADSGARKLIGEIAAGSTFDRAIDAGECAAIYTGAPVPDGADAVVPVEFTSKSQDAIDVNQPLRAGQNIARRGADCREGQVVIEHGRKLTPAAIAVAASVGAQRVDVFAQPRVAVLSSGNELIAIDESPRPEQIRNSNSAMLVALLHRLNCDVTDFGWTKDDPKLIHDAIDRALSNTDVLLISGGMSMGEYDFVPRVLKEMKFDLPITKLKIKPGKPFVFASGSNGKFVFGLPGNPVSGFVCTIRLAARLLARLGGGRGEDAEQWITGELTQPLGKNGPREFYQPATVNRDGTITPLGWKGSADIFTLVNAGALLVRVENEPALPAGSRVQALQILH